MTSQTLFLVIYFSCTQTTTHTHTQFVPLLRTLYTRRDPNDADTEQAHESWLHIIFVHLLPSVWINSNMFWNFYCAATVFGGSPEEEIVSEEEQRRRLQQQQQQQQLDPQQQQQQQLQQGQPQDQFPQRSSSSSSSSSKNQLDEDEDSLLMRPARYCQVCRRPKPLRTHHCR